MNSIYLFNKTSRECSRSVTKSYSTSFSWAIQLLHADIRDHIHGIYGFVRLADEVVDTFHDFDKEFLLNKFRQETYHALDEKISLNPIVHSFQLTVNQFNIPRGLIEAFFQSMLSDLNKKQWTSQEELKAYIYGSAEVVGLMCLHVFCEGNGKLADALTPSAAALGAAFQKVNFLRDLKDDMENLDRQYFPHVDFNNFNAPSKKTIEADICKDFEAAFIGIQKLPLKARFGVLVAYRYYFCLFDKIRKLPPQALMQRRIRVPNMQKLLLLAQTALIGRWQLK